MRPSREIKHAGVGDTAVRKATGRGWEDWFSHLDALGASALSHRQIVALLSRFPQLTSWWRQQLTVGYEQARGLRDVHEKPAGYEIGRSKTLDVPRATVYAAWKDGRRRRAWLRIPDLHFRMATENRSLRIPWVDGRTHVDVHFYEKGPDRSVVSVHHGHLADAAEAERFKAFWSEALERLKEMLEQAN